MEQGSKEKADDQRLLADHHHRLNLVPTVLPGNAVWDAPRPLPLDQAVTKNDAERRRLYSHGGSWERDRLDLKFVVVFRESLEDWLRFVMRINLPGDWLRFVMRMNLPGDWLRFVMRLKLLEDWLRFANRWISRNR